MRDLIERLAKAKSGSRELDCALYVALGRRPSWLGDGGILWVDTKDRAGPVVRFAYDGKPSTGNPPVNDTPAYTTSLDAIVALIEEKSPSRGPVTLLMAGSAEAYIDSADPCGPTVKAFGQTPALALCIALLRALHPQPGETP